MISEYRARIIGLYLFFPPVVCVIVALVFAFGHYVSLDPKEDMESKSQRTDVILKDKYVDIIFRLKIGAVIGYGIGLFVAYRCHVGERRRGAGEPPDQS